MPSAGRSHHSTAIVVTLATFDAQTASVFNREIKLGSAETVVNSGDNGKTNGYGA